VSSDESYTCKLTCVAFTHVRYCNTTAIREYTHSLAHMVCADRNGQTYKEQQSYKNEQTDKNEQTYKKEQSCKREQPNKNEQTDQTNV
jgi:hypothetical protein